MQRAATQPWPSVTRGSCEIAEQEHVPRSRGENLRDLENRISRDVQVAWLNANTAYLRLSLTAQLLNQAVQALDLAHTRYDQGLSYIVELSQAQLNKTSAEIASVSAKYEYDLQRAVLKFQQQWNGRMKAGGLNPVESRKGA
jgi:outer membrane protein